MSTPRPPVAAPHRAFGVFLGEVDRGGAELARHLKPFLDRVDGEDRGGAGGKRGLDGAEPHRP